jgi:hypothetical protein
MSGPLLASRVGSEGELYGGSYVLLAGAELSSTQMYNSGCKVVKSRICHTPPMKAMAARSVAAFQQLVSGALAEFRRWLVAKRVQRGVAGTVSELTGHVSSGQQVLSGVI